MLWRGLSCKHCEYSSEVRKNGAKESTRDIQARVRDLSGGKRRQNRTVYFCQGSAAAQENGSGGNDHQEEMTPGCCPAQVPSALQLPGTFSLSPSAWALAWEARPK